MKKRFRILREPLIMSNKQDMWMTYYTCVALHNFIRKENISLDCEFEVEVLHEEQISEHDEREQIYDIFEEDSEMPYLKTCGMII